MMTVEEKAAGQHVMKLGNGCKARKGRGLCGKEETFIIALRSSKREETKVSSAAMTAAEVTRQEQVCLATMPLPPRKHPQKITS